MRIKVIHPTLKMEEKRLKVCAYVRVSTDSLEQEDSLINQTEYFESYIKTNPQWQFAGIYADQGISGFKENRPQFQQMIADARAKKIDLIVVKSVSRFARNTETVLKFSRELKSIGVGIFFELQNINTLSGPGELMLSIIAAFAQAESQGASANANLTYQRKFKAGIPVHDLKRTFGYDSDADGNVLICEEEAKTVRLIFDLAEKRIWPSKIRRYLNNQGILSATGGVWDDCSIFRILHNPAYKGDLVQQKTFLDSNRVRHKNRGECDQWIVTENHRPIVSPAQWDVVQQILAERSNQLAPKPEYSPQKSHSCRTQYPFSNKLFCPHCGEKLIHKWSNGGRQEYWACRTNLKVGASVCKGIWLPASIANGWAEVSEPTTVVSYWDEYGMQQFTAYPKTEYEHSDDCPYQRKEC